MRKTKVHHCRAKGAKFLECENPDPLCSPAATVAKANKDDVDDDDEAEREEEEGKGKAKEESEEEEEERDALIHTLKPAFLT